MLVGKNKFFINKMDNEVKFNEWKPPQEWVKGKSKPGFGEKLANLIIKISRGKIKEERQANYVILVIIVAIFIISFILLSSVFGGSEQLEGIKILPAEF